MGKTSKPAAKKAPKSKTNKAIVVVDKAAEAEAKKKNEGLKILTPIAKEINVRFEKIAKLEGDANDHRLSAALKLDEAKQRCEQYGVKFKEWAAENVTQAWETVRKLVAIGSADDPKKALADMRDKNKKANKLHRDRKAHEAKAKAALPKPKPVDTIRALKPDEQADVVAKIAKDLDLVVVTKDEAKAIKQKGKDKPAEEAPKAGPDDGAFTLDGVKAAFKTLRRADKIAFVRWAASEIGVSVVDTKAPTPSEAVVDPVPEDGDMPDLPPVLRRAR